jgi:hypothetical protein
MGAASEPSPPAVDRWRPSDRLFLLIVFGLGLAVRLPLFPLRAHADVYQFAGWVHHIAANGLATLYGGTDAGPVTFGPVMAYVWAALAALVPAFQTATDAADPAIQAVMRVPPTLADFGLAALVVYALWDRPRWAIAGAAATLLILPTWYVSAWWGQYESIFMLTGLGAAIAAMRGHNLIAAALLMASLSTKPQAIPFIVPFAAWFWATGYARDGVRGAVLELAKAAAVGSAVFVVLWAPFLPSGGPFDYVDNVRYYQTEEYPILSLKAWNIWWLFQSLARDGGGFIRDDIGLVGPVTFRLIGAVVTAGLSLAIAIAIVRDRRPATLLTGLAASVLVFYTFMTQMHERYAYAAVLFLLLAIPTRVSPWLWVVFVATYSVNLVAAVPINEDVGALIPAGGLVGIVGSLTLIGVTVAVVAATRHPRDLRATAGPQAAGAPSVGRAPSGP